jgi:hypothetical protein
MTRTRGAVAVALAAALTLTGCRSHGLGGHRREHRYAARLLGNHRQLRCLDALWDAESGWDPRAVNARSGAYGIPQALPAAHGHPFALGDWRAQIRWGLRYIHRRYGTACAAEAHERAHGWY